ncbi:MAG: hypothetical protein IKA10_09155 [Oscillospiraceae bacterium]|nr:hypothetical protein [Oscillospiraceae bacterium]
MKTIVNTACAYFSINGTNRYSLSNNSILHILVCHRFVQGEVVCAPACRSWQIDIVQKNSGHIVFSLGGCKNKGFSFEPDTSFEYKLIFTADKNSTLRLYNTPGCVTDIIQNLTV